MKLAEAIKINIWQFLRICVGKVLYEKIRGRRWLGYTPNLKNPKTLNERIMHQKLFSVPENAVIIADKYEVRAYVAERLSEKYLTKLYFVGDNPDEIPFEALPNQFVIKTSHSSGGIYIIKDKRTLDVKKLKKDIKKILKVRLGALTNEWWYSKMKPRFIIEELLNDGVRDVPADYKFFCFNGKIKFFLLDTDRFGDHRRNIFDRNWIEQDFKWIYPRAENLQKPENYEELCFVAEHLAKDYDFIRIDLYCFKDQIKFGEMTLAPGAGYEKFESYEQDLMLGKLWESAEN